MKLLGFSAPWERASRGAAQSFPPGVLVANRMVSAQATAGCCDGRAAHGVALQEQKASALHLQEPECVVIFPRGHGSPCPPMLEVRHSRFAMQPCWVSARPAGERLGRLPRGGEDQVPAAGDAPAGGCCRGRVGREVSWGWWGRAVPVPALEPGPRTKRWAPVPPRPQKPKPGHHVFPGTLPQRSLLPQL